MTSPTILQIVPQLDTGGAELSAIEIAEAVVRAGGRSLIATEGGRLEALAEEQGAMIVRLSVATKNPWRIVHNAQRLAELSRREGVSLLHARSRAPAWSTLMAARRAKLPFVTTYHGAYNEHGPIKRWYNSVMAKADLVIANSAFTADLIRQRYGTPDSRIRIIHRGVDRAFDRNLVSPERIASVRARWGVSKDQRVILHAARLTGWKGQAVVIDAARELRARGRLADTQFVLAGDAQGRDSYRTALENQIAEGGLADHVRLVGHEHDMAAAFAAAHVGVVASTEPEAFGRACTEAQALGCPVIATRLGAPPETVIATPEASPAERTGWLVKPSDAPALADALTEALDLTDDDRHNLGLRAARHVKSNFSLEKMKRSTLQVYDELLGTDTVNAFECALATSF